MVLIPGLGFGGDVFEGLVGAFEESHRIWSVTLAGFGGTPPPPVPPPGTSFGEQTWTESAFRGLEKLLLDEDIRDAVVVGHWLTGARLALDLGAAHPDRVRAVVLLAGSARLVRPGTPVPPLAARVAVIDTLMAPRWFKTVTRETWDDNNFLPQDYAADPVLGLRYWREAARPRLDVWVRYLCEFYAQDATEELTRVRVPVVLLHPGLEGIREDPANPYMRAFTAGSWGESEGRETRVRTIPDTRIVMWADRLDAVVQELRAAAAPPGS
ncbi:MAG: hypothetical protein AMXMBFR53_35600 [Gemmatimonadota bacterium]